MSSQCSNCIILDDLILNIDLNDLYSWDLNTGLTLDSTYKWKYAQSIDANLVDFGLTAYDNGMLNDMNTGLTLSYNDNNLKLFRVGSNDASGNTSYSGYSITSFTGTSVGNYFYLNGGYFQGFYKLHDTDFKILPARYDNGITIETIIEILPNSSGIFYYMGTRSEDKYNSYFSGETTIVEVIPINNSGYTETIFSGITTSEGNYLNAYEYDQVHLNAFQKPEEMHDTINLETPQINNISNNVIAFELTNDLRLSYKYIDNLGNLIQYQSPNKITRYGWTIIDIVFKPYKQISNYDDNKYLCYGDRYGDLLFYVNGRLFWKVDNFLEWYGKPINNDWEKQLGVPFNIAWGGGSFGLKHSWHYNNDYNELVQDERKNNLTIEKYFSNSYIGNVQKLKVYNMALNSNEILQNTVIQAKLLPAYNININKGGRLINNVLSTVNISQTVSGSDIRKSIKYRTSNNTYRNLSTMSDIMVVIKSKSNPNIELIKYKIVGDVDWLPLIYIDDYTYDFIVPDEITSAHPNEVLFAEIKFQWPDPYDIDNIYDKIFIVNLTTSALLDNTIKNY